MENGIALQILTGYMQFWLELLPLLWGVWVLKRWILD